MKAIKAIYKKDLERIQAENKEMKELLQLVLDVKTNFGFVNYSTLKKIESLLETINILKT